MGINTDDIDRLYFTKTTCATTWTANILDNFWKKLERFQTTTLRLITRLMGIREQSSHLKFNKDPDNQRNNSQ